MGENNILMKLIKGNNEDLVAALYVILVIAKRINNKEIEQWVYNEINGYEDKKLPSYRIHKSYNIRYSGFNNSVEMDNQPLPISNFPIEEHDNIATFKCNIGIPSIIDLLKSENSYLKDLTGFSGYIQEKRGIQCIKISNYASEDEINKIVSHVKTKAVCILSDIANENINIDDLDFNEIDIKKDAINKSVNNYINQSINFGDNNKLKKSTLSTINGGEKVILNEKKKKKFHWIFKVLIPIFVGVVTAIILKLLNIY